MAARQGKLGAQRADGMVPHLWDGATCAIFASGPTLTADQVERCRAAGLRAIAVNNGYRIAPWADAHLFYDLRWWGWHEAAPEWRAFAGRIFTLENGYLASRDPRITCIRMNQSAAGLSLNPCEINHGKNVGFGAINLAVLLGASRIVLLGYDMRRVDGRTYWHPDHPCMTHPRVFEATMLPMFDALPGLLEAAGVSIVNCTPRSALRAFPMASLESELAEHGR
jgi:hypothetical protein